jgi:probable mannosyltransferase
MKKVLFDGTAIQPSAQAPFHGGSEYAKYVLREIINRNYSFEIVFQKNLSIPEDISKIINHSDCKIHYIETKSDIYRLISTSDFDVFYSALPYIYFDYKEDTPILGVIHGLRSIEFPWDKYAHRFINSSIKKIIGWFVSKVPYFWVYLKNRNIARMSKLILNHKFQFITVSEHSKYSLINFYPSLRDKKIEVCYSPLNITRSKIKTADNGNYYLLVSGNRVEKNVTRVLLAFDDLFTKGLLDEKTVKITGITNPKLFSFLKNKNRFTFLPYVSSQELESLYQKAFCFVYPSLNEGFGYPPLQAMANNVPIIASSATSIPEVCGNAAIYFPPTNLDDLKCCLLQINDNLKLRLELIQKGEIRLKEIRVKQEEGIDRLINLIFK